MPRKPKQPSGKAGGKAGPPLIRYEDNSSETYSHNRLKQKTGTLTSYAQAGVSKGSPMGTSRGSVGTPNKKRKVPVRKGRV